MQRKYNHLDRALIILGFNSDDVVCSTPPCMVRAGVNVYTLPGEEADSSRIPVSTAILFKGPTR